MISKRKEMKLRKAAVKQSLAELGQLNAALTASYRNFNSVSDPVVMDACIYEINALRSLHTSRYKKHKQYAVERTLHMETLSSILMAAAVIAVIILLLKIIAAPMKLAFKLLLNALFGFIILFVFNFFGDFVGFTLGINWVNALITGCLGVPGVILLILIKLFF